MLTWIAIIIAAVAGYAQVVWWHVLLSAAVVMGALAVFTIGASNSWRAEIGLATMGVQAIMAGAAVATLLSMASYGVGRGLRRLTRR